MDTRTDTKFIPVVHTVGEFRGMILTLKAFWQYLSTEDFYDLIDRLTRKPDDYPLTHQEVARLVRLSRKYLQRDNPHDFDYPTKGENNENEQTQ